MDMDGITVSMDMSLSKLREMVKDSEAAVHGVLQFMGSQRVRHNLVMNNNNNNNNLYIKWLLLF